MNQLAAKDVQSIEDKIAFNNELIMEHAGNPEKVKMIQTLKKVNPILEKTLSDINKGVYGTIKEENL